MLEEIIGFALSICSLFAADTPKVSSDIESSPENTNLDFNEFQNDEEQEFISKEFIDNNDDDSSQYGTSYSNCQNGGNVCKIFWKCLLINLNIILTTMIPISFAMALVYVAMNTIYSCMEWQNHNNNTLPLSAKRAHLFGGCIQSFEVYLWFPWTLMILFGWKEFKAKFLSTVYVGVIFGELIIISNLILFQFDLFDKYIYYRYPFFGASLLCSTLVILYNIRASERLISYSNFHIAALVLIEFISCALLSYFYKFIVVPVFKNVRANLYKFLIATSSPLSALIPTVLCAHMALRRSSEIVHPGRSFILVSMIRGGVIFLYRTMQTNFKSIWIFIGLSLFSAVLNFLKRATQQVRIKLWKRIISALNNFNCCRALQILPCNSAHSRRLNADLAIQDTLFEYNTLILSQTYFISYQLQNFNIATEALSYGFFKRIAIGVLIDLIFNCMSNYVQIYYYNIPIGRVWKKYWKRHLLANTIVILTIIAYFSEDFESIFRSHFEDSSKQHVIKNCSLF